MTSAAVHTQVTTSTFLRPPKKKDEYYPTPTYFLTPYAPTSLANFPTGRYSLRNDDAERRWGVRRHAAPGTP